MGTRNLTIVKIDDEYRVAQYCQWDGYPEGQGTGVYNFLNKILNTRLLYNRFKANLRKVRRMDAAEIEKCWASVGATGNMVSPDISNTFKKTFPSLHRDTGSDILDMILDKPGVPVGIDLEFWDDSLFCEWAYLIDMDKRELSVYRGGKNHLKTWKFEELPPRANFVVALNEE